MTTPIEREALSDAQIKAALPPMSVFLRESLYDYEQREVIAYVLQCVRAILAASRDEDRKLMEQARDAIETTLNGALLFSSHGIVPALREVMQKLDSRLDGADRALAQPSTGQKK